MTREELLRSKEYWIGEIQLDLFEMIDDYLTENKISRTEFAKKLGVNKSYVSQILNGNFNHSISKFVELSLAIGKVPRVKFQDIEILIEQDKQEDIHAEENFYNIILNIGVLHKKKILDKDSSHIENHNNIEIEPRNFNQNQSKEIHNEKKAKYYSVA